MNQLGVYTFIINAAAGGGRAAKVRPTIERFMAAHRVECEIAETTSPVQATELSRDAALNGRIPVAVGGDGSIHHVFSGVVDASDSDSIVPQMGILPVGTGNDLARMLRIPLTFDDALAMLVAGATRRIDYGVVEWEGPSGAGSRPFVNCAGMGLDAQSALLAVKLKPYIGNLCYTVAPALCVWTWKRCEAGIEVEDAAGTIRRWSGGIFLASLANGRWVGGGIQISPDARIDDGLLDLCLIRAASPIRALTILAKAVKGVHNGLREVDARQIRSITISVSREVPIHLDGEPCTRDATTARFSTSTGQICVVAPT